MWSHGLGQPSVGSLQVSGGCKAPLGRPRLQVEGGHEGSESWWAQGQRPTRTFTACAKPVLPMPMPALAVLSSSASLTHQVNPQFVCDKRLDSA